jgi:AraC family transcriptional regulator
LTLGEIRSAGQLCTSLFSASQGPGDWSDAATGDLIINLILSDGVRANVDLGAGRFSGPITRRSFIITPPGVATKIFVDDPHEIVLLGLPYAMMREMTADLDVPHDGDFGRLHQRYLDDPAIANLLQRIWFEAGTGSVGGSLMADGLVLQLLSEVLRLAARNNRVAKGGLAPWQQRRCREALAAQLDNGMSLADLAALVGLSPWHFCRAFQHSMGTTPHHYQQQMRVTRACDALARSDTPITQIALDVGYGSSQAFARVFRNEMGCSPIDYRRERRR